MHVPERTYTIADVRLVSMYARLEGAPALADEILRDLDEKGKLSTPTRGAVGPSACPHCGSENAPAPGIDRWRCPDCEREHLTENRTLALYQLRGAVDPPIVELYEACAQVQSNTIRDLIVDRDALLIFARNYAKWKTTADLNLLDAQVRGLLRAIDPVAC